MLACRSHRQAVLLMMKLFDSELDQATFEEHMRWFFGNKVGTRRMGDCGRPEDGVTDGYF